MSAIAVAEAFERAPFLADRLAAEAPFAPNEVIVGRARELIGEMTEEQRITMLDAHPRIGAPPALLSALSAAEQGVQSDEETARELAEVNDAYERRFGFRCVVFVAGRSRADVLAIMRERLGRDRAEELAAAIEEFLAIASDRLERAR